MQNPKIVDTKSVITEHPETSHKSSKTIRQDEKERSNSSLYSDTKKSKKCLNQKNVKITKREHAFKGYVSSYNVNILNSFNSEIYLQYGIETKLTELLSQLKGFKFVTTLVLVFKKIESEDKTKYDSFYSSSKAEITISESEIDNVFQSIFITIMENKQKYLRKDSGWIIDSVIGHTIRI